MDVRSTAPAILSILLAVGAATIPRAEDGTAAEHDAARTPAADSALFFRDVRVFDGREVLGPRDVLVRGDTIAAVDTELAPPDGARVVAGEGRTLMPGLIDAHVHTLDPASLRQAAVLGVTTELDMFTRPELARRMKRQQASGGASTRADLFAAGHLATAPEGHGTQYGIDVPTLEGPDEAAAWVDERVEAGADYIKIVRDDGSVAGTSLPTLSLPTVRRLVDEAHAHDRLAVVHVSSLRASREVVRAGADVLAHVWMDSVPADTTVRAMAESGVAVTPTLSVIRSAAGEPAGPALAEDARLSPYLSSRTGSNLRATFPGEAEGGDRSGRTSYAAARRSVAKMAEAGVPLLAGSDAPNPGTAHGPSLHGELALLVEAGLEPVEALRAATSVPARIFGLEDRGRLEPGRRADLLLVEGNPAGDVTATRAIVGVWKGGRRIDRSAFREEVAAAAEESGKAPAGSESGLVSDFEGDAPSARFGTGWQVSTDQMMGGTSEASMAVVEGGAGGSSGALEITGRITDTARYPWAGAFYLAGPSMRQGANLSAWDAVSFRVRGSGATHRLMVFAETLGRRPATKTFLATGEWTRHVFPLEAFRGIDGSGLVGVLFTSEGTGRFEYRIDDVRFVRQERGSSDGGS